MMTIALISQWPRLIAKLAGGLVSFVGASVLFLGWGLNIPVLKSVLPGLPKMVAGTALLFLIAGVSLWCAAAELSDSSKPPANDNSKSIYRWLGVACASIVTIFGAVRLTAYVIGWGSPRLDYLWFGQATLDPSPDRMSPSTALAFVLIGCGLLL